MKVDGLSLCCARQSREEGRKRGKREQTTLTGQKTEKSGNILLSVAERYFVVTAFNTSGRIFMS